MPKIRVISPAMSSRSERHRVEANGDGDEANGDGSEANGTALVTSHIRYKLFFIVLPLKFEFARQAT